MKRVFNEKNWTKEIEKEQIRTKINHRA